MPRVTRRRLLAGAGALVAAPSGAGPARPDRRRWWQDAVFYQIYPRSFMDFDGDGIGDLRGIIARLDHLRRLGVDAVWLSPHFDSPGVDNGYDIRDYRKVAPVFGTMADFDRLVSELRRRDMRLVIDLVVNHTSDEHDWFRQSRASRENPYRDFYIWRDGRDGGPPNNYPSFFGGSAWQHDEPSGQYYLHYFHRKQPDLNWANPRVREAVKDVMRFWLAKGVAGFRMDVIPFIAKPAGLPDLTPDELRRGPEYRYAASPDLHRYLRELRVEVLDTYDAVAIGESWGVPPADLPALIDPRRGELDMVLSSEVADVGRAGWRTMPWTVADLRAALDRQDAAAGPDGWTSLFLGNHDYPRMLSHFGDDDPAWRERSAKALLTLLLTRRATPFLYQGDEIGMTNFPFGSIAAFDDVAARAKWAEFAETGRMPRAEVLAELRRTSRDNARTPMQWTGRPGAGFTTGRPWLAINADAARINVAEQAGRAGSVLEHACALIALRRRDRVLTEGDQHPVATEAPGVIAYERRLGPERRLVAINLGRAPASLAAPGRADPLTADGARVAAGTTSLRLDGWQAGIWRIS